MRIAIVVFLMLSVPAVSAFCATNETPQTPDDLVRQGWRMLDRGVNIEALAVFQEALKAAPDNVDAHRGYQDAMLALGKKDELIAEYKKMTEEKPNSAAACYLYSRLLDDPDEEKDWLDKAKALDDKFPYTYYGLGLRESETGDKESAEKDLRRALELKPDFPEAYRALGMLYVGERKADDAEKLYLDAAKNLPKESFPHSYLSDIYYKQKKDNDKALAEINAAIAIAADRPDFYVRKAEILAAKGDKAEAVNALRKICELEPTIFEARDAGKIAAEMTTPELGFEDPAYDKAVDDIGEGNTADAIAGLTKLAEARGDVALVDYQLGRAYEVEGRKENGAASLEKAVEYYDKAAKAAPEFANAFYGLASVQYVLAGLLADDKASSEQFVTMSEKIAQHVLALNPIHSDANLLLAKICHGRGEYEKALQYAACCYKIAQDYKEVRPVLIDIVRIKQADEKPETEFTVDEYSVKAYPVPNVPGNVGAVGWRFDVYKGDALYKQFFEEILTDTDEATGELVTKYYLCELLDKDNNTTDILLPTKEEPTTETYQAALKNALNPQPPGE